MGAIALCWGSREPPPCATDGRDWPKGFEATFAGYSLGKWIDTDGDGRYDVLEVETRDLKGPRAYDGTGLPLHEDNQTVIKERLYTDKADPNIIINEITTIDSALMRPWTAVKKYRRVAAKEEAVWPECREEGSRSFDFAPSSNGERFKSCRLHHAVRRLGRFSEFVQKDGSAPMMM